MTTSRAEAQRSTDTRGTDTRAASKRVTEDWVLLASREVDRTQGRERIDVSTAPGSIKAVRLIAKRNEIELTQVRIRYADGRVHDEIRAISMNPNDRTRPMDEGRGEAFADEIELVLRPARLARGADRTTTIEVWGLQTSTGAKAMRPAIVSQATTGRTLDEPTSPVPVAAPVPAVPAYPAAPVATSPPPVASSSGASPPLASLPPASSASASSSGPQAAAAEPAARATSAVPPPVTVAAPAPVTPQPAVEPTRAAPDKASPRYAPAGGASPATAPAVQPPPPHAPPSQSPGIDPNAVGPPGSAPPLPPSRGPHARTAALPKLPAPSTRVSAPSADETHEGMFLGRKTLPASVEVDRIPVGIEIGRLAKVRLRALDGRLRLAQLKIIYADGAPDILAYHGEVAANARTEWISLPSERAVREIEITQTLDGGHRNTPTVEVYGEPADGYLDPGGEGARLVRYSGWVPLGARTAAMRIGFDQLELHVGPNKGGFRKLRVDAKGRAVTLREVRVVYASGDDEVVAIDSARQKLSAGASFGPIELRGHARPIKTLILKTRSRFLDSDARAKDAAIVEVWAQH